MKRFALATLATVLCGLISIWAVINLPDMTSRSVSNVVTLVAGAAMVVCGCYAFLQFARLLEPKDRKMTKK